MLAPGEGRHSQAGAKLLTFGIGEEVLIVECEGEIVLK